jgi:uncharacterized membrane protein YgcG
MCMRMYMLDVQLLNAVDTHSACERRLVCSLNPCVYTAKAWASKFAFAFSNGSTCELLRHGVVTAAKLTVTPRQQPPPAAESGRAGLSVAAEVARVERLDEDIADADEDAKTAAAASPPWGGYALHLACLTAGIHGESPPALLIRPVTLPSSSPPPGHDDYADELSASPPLHQRLPPSSEAADPPVLAEYPGASALLSAGGGDFWVVSRSGGGGGGGGGSGGGGGGGGGGGSGGVIAYRWSTAHRQAVARVDIGTAAAAADAAVEIGCSGGGKNGSGGLGRLAASLHFPSNELIALTDRGNVLTVSPPLQACPLGRDEGDGGGGGGGGGGGSGGGGGGGRGGKHAGVRYGQTVSRGGGGGGGDDGDDVQSDDNRGGTSDGLSPPAVRHVVGLYTLRIHSTHKLESAWRQPLKPLIE